MIISVFLICLIIGLLIGLPILVVRIYHSNRFKRWQKPLISFLAIGGSFLFIMAIYVATIIMSVTYSFVDHNLPKAPKHAKSYLEDIGIGIEFPDFKVDAHRLQRLGGDETEEYWIITFREPLSAAFLSQLDSLCRADGARWRHYDKHIRHGGDNDYNPCYEFSYWNPELIELHEMVSIFPERGSAILSHIHI